MLFVLYFTCLSPAALPSRSTTSDSLISLSIGRLQGSHAAVAATPWILAQRKTAQAAAAAMKIMSSTTCSDTKSATSTRSHRGYRQVRSSCLLASGAFRDRRRHDNACIISIDLCFCFLYLFFVVVVDYAPRRGLSGGHRADDWDVEKWMTIQRIRVATQGRKCRIVLEDKEDGTLFAEAPQGPEVGGNSDGDEQVGYRARLFAHLFSALSPPPLMIFGESRSSGHTVICLSAALSLSLFFFSSGSRERFGLVAILRAAGRGCRIAAPRFYRNRISRTANRLRFSGSALSRSSSLCIYKYV